MMQRRTLLAACLGFWGLGNSAAEACGLRWRRRSRVLRPCPTQCEEKPRPIHLLQSCTVIYYYECPTESEIYVQVIDHTASGDDCCTEARDEAANRAEMHCTGHVCTDVICELTSMSSGGVTTLARKAGWYYPVQVRFARGNLTVVGFGRDNCEQAKQDALCAIEKLKQKHGENRSVKWLQCTQRH